MIGLLPTSFGPIGLVGLVGVVVGVMGLLMRSTSKGGRPVREGRVLGIIGRKGAGKSLLATHELLRAVGVRQRCEKCSREHGARIVHHGHIASNASIKLSPAQAQYFHPVKSWWDLVGERPPDEWGDKGEHRYFFKLPHCTTIVIDEADLWLPARQGESAPEHVRWYMKQCRKGVQEVIWIAQNETRVALALRQLTDELGWVTRGLFGARKVQFWEVENYKKLGRKPDWTFRYRVTKKIADSYDTYELLMPDEEISERRAKAPVPRQGLGAAAGERPSTLEPASSATL